MNCLCFNTPRLLSFLYTMITQNPYEAPVVPLEEHDEQVLAEQELPLAIGGWLILVGIGVVFTPLRILYNVVPSYWRVFNNGLWHKLAVPDSPTYNPAWRWLVTGELVSNVVLFSGSLYLFYLFFSKKKVFPRWYIGLTVFSVIFMYLDAQVAATLFKSLPFNTEKVGAIVRTLFVALIWIPYMLMSKRVKETFLK